MERVIVGEQKPADERAAKADQEARLRARGWEQDHAGRWFPPAGAKEQPWNEAIVQGARAATKRFWGRHEERQSPRSWLPAS